MSIAPPGPPPSDLRVEFEGVDKSYDGSTLVVTDFNLSIRKELLRRRGAIECARPRPPFAPIDAGTQAEIDWIFARVGINDPTRILELN